MNQISTSVFRALTVGVLITIIPGCSLLATISYISGGGMVDPEYDGLEGKRVAVLCVSDSSSYGSGTESLLAQGVAAILKHNVKEIDVVSWSEVADWIDKNGWDQVDYREVGRGVKADRVVAVDLEGFQLHESSTLYRGRAAMTVTVYDMTQNRGKEVYRTELPEVTFPTNAPYHESDTSEAKFRSSFLRVLSNQVARLFYPYEVFDDYNRDPALLE